MSILKLMRDRQMYKYGQRVGFRGGGMDMGNASNQAQSASMGNSSSNNGGGGGNDNRGPRGPSELGATTRSVNPMSISPVDRSAVSQFSTFGRNTMNQNLQGPSAFSNITGGIKDYVLNGGLIGMGIRGLTGLYDKVTGPKATEYGNLDIPGYNMLNIAGPKSYDFGPAPGEGNDNQGIMAAYIPNMLDTAEEEIPLSQEEEDFKQRFRVANEFRQDKQGQLDPTILEMISKLYT
jgi:hypothetical protein